MNLPSAPPQAHELPPPPRARISDDAFPSRGTVWILSIFAVILIIEAAAGAWSPLDLFR